MADRFSGMDELLRLFDTVPAAANDELKSLLEKIGGDVLAQQKAEVPVRTGDLWRGLALVPLLDQLKVRVGLLGFKRSSKGKRNYGGLFYGRFIEFGRHAQVVMVHRLTAASRKAWVARIRRGQAIARRKPKDLVTTYALHVKARAPHPFVYGPAAEAAALTGAEQLANFWSNVLARADA